MSFPEYLTSLRIKEACKLLTDSSESIDNISLLTGFDDYFYFNKVFKKTKGMTPRQYRIKGRDEND